MNNDALARALRPYTGPCSDGDLLRIIRARMNLNQTEFGKLIGVEKITVAQWEQGTRFMKQPTRLLLRLIYQFPDILEHLDPATDTSEKKEFA
jgi:DNA-binding transcriptional regulator YiaG